MRGGGRRTGIVLIALMISILCTTATSFAEKISFRLIGNDAATDHKLHDFHHKHGRGSKVERLIGRLGRPRVAHQEDQSDHLSHQQEQGTVFDDKIASLLILFFLGPPLGRVETY